MRRIFERLFLLIFTLVVGSQALSSLLSLMKAPDMRFWVIMLGGGLVLLIVLGYVFKVQSAQFTPNQTDET